MARRRTTKGLAKLEMPTILDITIANAIVRIAPDLISKVVAIPAGIQSIVGVGAGFLAGSFFKKPLIANASIATGIIDLAVPMIEDMIGTSTGMVVDQNGQLITGGESTQNRGIPASQGVGDFLRLQEYISNPGVTQNVYDYRYSY